MALAAWFGIVHEDVRPRAVFADEAVGLAQRDDLARVPLAAHPWLHARVRGAASLETRFGREITYTSSMYT